MNFFQNNTNSKTKPINSKLFSDKKPSKFKEKMGKEDQKDYKLEISLPTMDIFHKEEMPLSKIESNLKSQADENSINSSNKEFSLNDYQTMFDTNSNHYYKQHQNFYGRATDVNSQNQSIRIKHKPVQGNEIKEEKKENKKSVKKEDTQNVSNLNKSIVQVFQSLSEIKVKNESDEIREKTIKSNNNSMSQFLLKNINSVNNSIYFENQNFESQQNNTTMDIENILIQFCKAENSKNVPHNKKSFLRKGSSVTKTSKGTRENSLSVVKDIFNDEFSMFISKTPKQSSVKNDEQIIKNKQESLKAFFKSDCNLVVKSPEVSLKNHCVKSSNQNHSEKINVSSTNKNMSKVLNQNSFNIKNSNHSELIKLILNSHKMKSKIESHTNSNLKSSLSNDINKKVRLTSQEFKQKLEHLNKFGESFVEAENLSKYKESLMELHEHIKQSNEFVQSKDTSKQEMSSNLPPKTNQEELPCLKQLTSFQTEYLMQQIDSPTFER
jgi:hypothetical protein